MFTVEESIKINVNCFHWSSYIICIPCVVQSFQMLSCSVRWHHTICDMQTISFRNKIIPKYHLSLVKSWVFVNYVIYLYSGSEEYWNSRVFMSGRKILAKINSKCLKKIVIFCASFLSTIENHKFSRTFPRFSYYLYFWSQNSAPNSDLTLGSTGLEAGPKHPTLMCWINKYYVVTSLLNRLPYFILHAKCYFDGFVSMRHVVKPLTVG